MMITKAMRLFLAACGGGPGEKGVCGLFAAGEQPADTLLSLQTAKR